MSVAIAALILVLLAAVIALVSHPLLVARHESAELSAERAELDAAREAKYREIRDADLDYRTGKLSHEDFAAVDASLRSEALEILGRLDALAEREREGS